MQISRRQLLLGGGALQLLLGGHSEKQIAAKLSVSRHTVHVYVKDIYRRFGASSRAELLARWVKTD